MFVSQCFFINLINHFNGLYHLFWSSHALFGVSHCLRLAKVKPSSNISKKRLYRNFICKPLDANKEIYKKYRNKLNRTLRLAQQNYLNNLLEMKRIIWETLGKFWILILGQIVTQNVRKNVVSKNEIYTYSNEIASKFNQYFANIGPKLASTIHHEGKNFSSYLQNQSDATCFSFLFF